MAEKKDTTSREARAAGPELRLIDRRAFVGFPKLVLSPGVVVQDFALQIPDVTFPMNVSGGATRYQKKKLDFGFLELAIDAEVIVRRLTELAGKLAELDDPRLHFRPGYLEVQARVRSADRTPVTFKVAFDGDGEKLAIYFYDVRFYGFSPTPAARLPAMVSEAIKELSVLPDVERRGANGFTTRVLPLIVEQAAVARGYKMPSLDQARLAEASISGQGLRLRFTAGGLPPPAAPDEELLLALEGARAFADAEELLAQGKLAEARAAYLRLGDATEAHPFAVERLLTLLVADPSAHELALDIAASLGRRRPNSATALWAEAVVRERRGESARAAERYLALSALARTHQEEAGAFFAAEASARAARDHAPQMAVKALHELLGLKPDHLPSLKALARASDQANDRAGAIRAYRRLAALARDSADAADAHVQLARLCAQTEDDIAGARLHCEAALRLTPDHPEALLQLGELCYRSQEHLRAIKALDRLREVAMGRHEVDRVGRANLLAGLVWEKGLKQPENALLRFREAASLLPGEPEPLYLAARVADSLGRIQEAVGGYQQAIELAGPAPRTEEIRKAAHDSHHSLARLLKTKLGEPARAREHLEAALALDPADTVALDELLPYFRASGKAPELAEACEKAAAVSDDPLRRAALWAEAGELYRGRLGQPDRAERLLTQALEADGKNRIALEGMLALAEARRDGGQLCRCLRALAELAEEPKERVRHYRRLAVAARDLAFDLDLAVHAYREVLRIEPDDLPVLGELTGLERRRADMGGLASALEQRARAAETLGDRRLAAAALRELGQVLDVRLGRSADALVALEKAARLHPEPNALLELANLCLRLERAVNARRALEDAIALLPRHAPPEKLAEVRAKLGKACELLGDRDAARENYALAFPLRRLDDELAGRLEALYLEGNHTRELTDLWAARAQALMQANRAQDAAPFFFKSAQTLLKAGDSAGAILRLNAALDAAPTGERAAEALEAMGQLELDRSEPGEAARLFARRAQLAELPRESARWLFKAAGLVKDTPREAQYLAQALEKDGTFIPARIRRADLLEKTNPREALADLEVVLNADPKDPDAAQPGERLPLIRRAAFAALKAGQADTGRRLLAQYTAHKPEDTEALLELVKLHRRAGAGEALVDLLGELWPRLEGAERQAARKEFTEGALSLGRTEAAVDALRSMLLEEPGDAWAAARLLGLLPEGEGSARERLELVSRLVATAQGEERAELLARRAELHRLAGDLSAARADLLDASQHASRPLPLLRALAELARQSKDEAAELSAWRLVLERSGKDPSLQADAVERLMALARSRTAAGDLPHAMEAWEGVVALPLAPADRFEAWFGLAQTARAVGSPRRAEEALLEASRQGPVMKRVDALLERAGLLEARGAREEAIGAFEAALALAPRHEPTLLGLKRALREQGDWEGLAEVLAAEAAHTPRAKAGPLFAELATLYLDKLQQPGPGEAALRRVIALDEKDVEARRRLAGLLAARGESGEAVTLLEEAAGQLPPAQAAPLLREGAALARAAGELELELRLMRLAHALVPATGEALAQLTEALYLHGAVKEAMPLQQALARAASFEDAPDVAERVLLRLADLAEQVGDGLLAESTLRRVVHERPLNSGAVERLAALIEPRDPRAALELLARHAQGLALTSEAAERLHALARKAHTTLHDLELAHTLYAKAAALSDSPLPIRLEVANLLRQAGRTPELIVELLELAQLHVTAGNTDAALQAWDEEARLAEGLGRVDDALRTLTAMSEVCEDDGREAEAARFHVRRAELLRDSKLDLDAAGQALSKAWSLEESPGTAFAAMELARRRGDREGQIDWLERSLAHLPAPAEKARAFVQLARLHLGLPSEGGAVSSAPLLAPDQAEAALVRALQLDPKLAEAETMLLALFERQDRVSDIAAHFEEAAARAPDVQRRAELLLRAAELYKDRAGRPQDAAAALLAARAANPDDASLTARVAQSLHELGRHQEAADFDAVLLANDPFHAAFERHRVFLEESGDALSLAGLLSRRAERLEGEAAAAAWLEAAAAFRTAGALERAQLCETQAFEAAPENLEAFELLLSRAEGEPRRQAELLAMRARAVPAEGSGLLQRRAQLLTRAGEALLAAGAWDDYLAMVPDDLAALEARAELAAQAGTPRASQPFDRRLVQVGGELLAPALRLKTWMRLGQAALEAQAWRDAVDAFEAALAVEPDGPRSQEALSFLSEAYGRLRDPAGQYRTTVRLAKRAAGGEAEALYRRALTFIDDPPAAIEALEALLALHPGEIELYERGVDAYRALGRAGDLLQLHERFAAAVGGARAAQAFLDAAALVEQELGDAQRAFELRQEAVRADPHNRAAVEAVLAESRRRGDGGAVIEQLRRLTGLLAEGGREDDAVTGLRLELAGLLEQRGDAEGAAEVLETMRAAGPSASGYSQALTGLERLAAARGDEARVAELRLAAAEILGAADRAARLLDAARSFQNAGSLERAEAVTRESLAAHGSREGWELLVTLTRALGRPEKTAAALTQLATESKGEERIRLLLEASEAWSAAGDAGAAADVLERVVREAPTALSPDALADRFLSLGDSRRAAELGFGPAVERGDFARALALAEGADDPSRAREVRWKLAVAEPAQAQRLAAELRAEADVEGLEKLAEALEASAPAQAVALRRELLFSFHQQTALEALATRGLLEVVLNDALQQRDAGVLGWLWPHLHELPEGHREALLQALAELVPERRAAALRELATLQVALGRPADAAASLAQLASLEEDARARAALQLERGELLAHVLQPPDAAGARAAFERALADDAGQVAAVRALVELYQTEAPEKFVAMAERLATLAGPEAIAGWRPALADAYEALGRTREAYRLLAELEETPDRIRRRAQLAQALGLGGEALSLREKISESPQELEAILTGYLEAQLVVFAVRLGERLLEKSALSPQTMRLMAERLAPLAQGAPLAARAWPSILREKVADADGWTLFAEALRNLGRTDAASVADGLGAALTSSAGQAPMAQPHPLVVPSGGRFERDSQLEATLSPVTLETMPRLAAAMTEALEGFGISGMQLMLDAAGGVEAWLSSERVLVIGAGALSVFGQSELTWLIAFAVALGARGRQLREVGEVEDMPEAAVAAFEAWPSSLAAARVLAQLDARVRGGDPALVDLSVLLPDSAAFHAVALRALELLAP